MLRRLFPTWGRQAVQRLIATRQVLVNGQAVWLASWQVHDGDRLTLLTQPQPKPQAATAFAAEWLLAVETDMIVVDKPAGLLAEPTRWGEGANLRDLAVGSVWAPDPGASAGSGYLWRHGAGAHEGKPRGAWPRRFSATRSGRSMWLWSGRRMR